MKRFRRIMSLVLVAVMLVTGSTIVRADSLITESALISDSDLTLTGLNNLSVRTAVSDYFNERAAYLLGEDAVLDAAVIGIVNDEAAHIAQLAAKSVTIEDSQFVIDSVECYDSYAEATVTETLSYSANGETTEEEVVHNIRLYLDENSVPVVAADAYKEYSTNFTSSSYVSTSGTATNATSGGGGPCMTYVARNEIGIVETGTNNTKYGEWYGWNGVGWCAIFVSWCANKASVDTSIVPKTASPLEMLNTLNNQGRFYYSAANGGTQSPKIGDIFFLGTSISNPSHVGIIVSVDVDNIYVVDGNWSDQVSYHQISRSATDLLGFARPNYATSVHTYTYETNSTHHWGSCDNCGRTTSTTTHTYSGYKTNSSKHWQECMTCGYATTKVAHTGGSYNSNASYHWKNCTICSLQMSKTAHTLVLISAGEGYRCSVCGHQTSASTLA